MPVAVAQNIVANFVGRAVTTLLGLAIVPTYGRLMGMEAFGLVGFFATLQALLTLLDFGITPMVSRELARLSARDDEVAATEMRDLVRTVGTGYALIGAASGILVALLAPVIARHWINAEHLPPHTVTGAIMLMGLVLALQWPQSVFSGGIMALQQQVVANQLYGAMSVVRTLGAYALLRWVSPTLEAFFVWQAVVSSVHTLALMMLLRRSMPRSNRAARFRKDLLVSNWKFAAGMSGVMIAGMVLSQADKAIASRLLPLEQFGYYALAATAANGLYNITGPISAAVGPRLVQLVAGDDEGALRAFYHRGCQALSALLLPPTMVLVVYREEVLAAWTGDPAAVRNGRDVLALLAIGTCLNGLMGIPYSLQVAHGSTRLALVINAIALLVGVPAMWLSARTWGAVGAAVGWVAYNGCALVALAYFTHRHLMPGEGWRWLSHDVALPFAAVLAATALGWLIPAPLGTRVGMLAHLVAVGAVMMGAALLATPATRAIVRGWLARLAART